MPVELILLLLLLIANGAPVITRVLLHDWMNFPLDGGYRFFDQQPLFGSSKTVRGILAAIIATAVAATLMGLSISQGALIGAMAMLGDLFSSFCKRRMKFAPSSMALGLDQIPESLFPLLAVKTIFGLGWNSIAMLVIAFIILELLLSQLLFRLNIRRRPY
ncbi:MAG: CDP-archaeol synthase [Gammaproteobacteria bacterium]